MDRSSKRPFKKGMSVSSSTNRKGTSPDTAPGSGSVVGKNLQVSGDSAENKRGNRGRGNWKSNYGESREKSVSAHDSRPMKFVVDDNQFLKSSEVDSHSKPVDICSRSLDGGENIHVRPDDTRVDEGRSWERGPRDPELTNRHRAPNSSKSGSINFTDNVDEPRDLENDVSLHDCDTDSRPSVTTAVDTNQGNDPQLSHSSQGPSVNGDSAGRVSSENVLPEPREPREPRDHREPREHRDHRDLREPREPREPKEPREPREPRAPRSGPAPRYGKHSKGFTHRGPKGNQSSEDRVSQNEKAMHFPKRVDVGSDNSSMELSGRRVAREPDAERLSRQDPKGDRHGEMSPSGDVMYTSPGHHKRRTSPRYSPDANGTPLSYTMAGTDGNVLRYDQSNRALEVDYNHFQMQGRGQMNSGVAMPCYPSNYPVPGIAMHGIIQGVPGMPVGQYMGNRWVGTPSPHTPTYVAPGLVTSVPGPLFVPPVQSVPSGHRVTPVQARKSSAFQIRNPETGEVLNTEAKAPSVAKPKPSVPAATSGEGPMQSSGERNLIASAPGTAVGVSPVEDPAELAPLSVPMMVPPMAISQPVGQACPGVYSKIYPQAGATGYVPVTPVMYTHAAATPITPGRMDDDVTLDDGRDQRSGGTSQMMASASLSPAAGSGMIPVITLSPMVTERTSRTGKYRVVNKAVESNDLAVALAVRHPLCDYAVRAAVRTRITNRRVDNTDYGYIDSGSSPVPDVPVPYSSSSPTRTATPTEEDIKTEYDCDTILLPPSSKDDEVESFEPISDTATHDAESPEVAEESGAVTIDSELEYVTELPEEIPVNELDPVEVVEESDVVPEEFEKPDEATSEEVEEECVKGPVKEVKSAPDSPKVLPDPFILDPMELQSAPIVGLTVDSSFPRDDPHFSPVYTIETILSHGFASKANVRGKSLGFKLVPIGGHSDSGLRDLREPRESRGRNYTTHSFSGTPQASSSSSSGSAHRNRLFERSKVDTKWRREVKAEPPRVSPFKKADISREEQFKRTVRSLLNKLTVEKFLTVAENLAVIYENLTIEDDVIAMVDLVLDKSVSELDYSDVYADLSFLLKYRFNSNFDVGFKSTLFYRVLLNKCQDSFEALSNVAMTASLLSSSEDLKDDAVECEKDDSAVDVDDSECSSSVKVPRNRTKKWVLGNIRFMGELFLRKILSVGILKRIARTLLQMDAEGSRIPCEYLVESFLELITTIGYTLEQSVHGPDMLNEYMGHLTHLKKHGNYSLRIVYKIQDLFDLRCKNWVKKVFKERATSVADIHLEAKQEELKGGAIHLNQEGKFTTAGRQARRHYTDYLASQRQIAFEKTVNGLYVAAASTQVASSSADADSTSSKVVPPRVATTTASAPVSDLSCGVTPKSALKTDMGKSIKRKTGEVRFAMDVVSDSVATDLIEVFLQTPSASRFAIEWEQYNPSREDSLDVVRRMLHKCVNARNMSQAESHCDLLACTIGRLLSDSVTAIDAFSIFEDSCLLRLQDEVLDNPAAVSLFSRILSQILDAFAANPDITLEKITLPSDFGLAKDLALRVLAEMKRSTSHVEYARNLFRRSFSSFKDEDLSFLDSV
ncbi:Eukaryotic translation initiation factor 4 gamma 1 [Babesia sp. Xinjiang]|uniref:Eukaryotic translation initiation factor 4 gamma 1 n=1 Tax=Babesia sp. Xinjiang TaxID=462227 RepID=UPI000A25AD86|nr:Eukaryotic translation initiation factor 4 gamma 1 [Babesia sp. Xinjiang]ORM39658.1 Eukaryotic translation initiation factor 4 gamma 1 [Babesia sp. Xinjiang]